MLQEEQGGAFDASRGHRRGSGLHISHGRFGDGQAAGAGRFDPLRTGFALVAERVACCCQASEYIVSTEEHDPAFFDHVAGQTDGGVQGRDEEALEQQHGAQRAGRDGQTQPEVDRVPDRHSEGQHRVAAAGRRIAVGPVRLERQSPDQTAHHADGQKALQEHRPVADLAGRPLVGELLAGGPAGTQTVKAADGAAGDGDEHDRPARPEDPGPLGPVVPGDGGPGERRTAAKGRRDQGHQQKHHARVQDVHVDEIPALQEEPDGHTRRQQHVAADHQLPGQRRNGNGPFQADQDRDSADHQRQERTHPYGPFLLQVQESHQWREGGDDDHGHGGNPADQRVRLGHAGSRIDDQLLAKQGLAGLHAEIGQRDLAGQRGGGQIQKGRADQHEDRHQNHEHHHERRRTDVPPRDHGQILAAFAHRHVRRHEVVHAAEEDAAQDDPQQGGSPAVEDRQHRPDDRSGPGDRREMVREDHRGLGGDVVASVIDGHGRRDPGLLLSHESGDQRSVEGAAQKQCNAGGKQYQ